MSNDDLFEHNEVLLDEDISLDNQDSEKKDDGFSVDNELRQIVRDLSEKLNNVDGFSFSLYSMTYFSFVNIPKMMFTKFYDQSSSMMIANYKASLGQHSAYTLYYLTELQRKIVLIGMSNTFAHQLLHLVNENIEGEPEDSFLSYCKVNLENEVTNNTFYMDELLNCYTNYCASNEITIDSTLVEHQLKFQVDQIERNLYGSMYLGNHIAGVGEVKDFVDRRDQLLLRVVNSAFKFVNKIQSAIDTVKSEQDKFLV